MCSANSVSIKEKRNFPAFYVRLSLNIKEEGVLKKWKIKSSFSYGKLQKKNKQTNEKEKKKYINK